VVERAHIQRGRAADLSPLYVCDAPGLAGAAAVSAGPAPRAGAVGAECGALSRTKSAIEGT
jgi:hypothetical protein